MGVVGPGCEEPATVLTSDEGSPARGELGSTPMARVQDVPPFADRRSVDTSRSHALHVRESMIEPSFYLPLARAVEDAGYDTMVVPDSICYPAESESVYPSTRTAAASSWRTSPSSSPSPSSGHGAVTERLRFLTFVLKLPVRHRSSWRSRQRRPPS